MTTSYIITEEPVQPVMFQRLYREAQTITGPGDDVIVYIENRKRIFVRDSPHLIKGIADLLTIQGISFKTFRNEKIGDINDLFLQLPKVS